MHGLRAAMLAEVHLRDCEVPANSLIGRERLPSGLLIGTALHHGRYSVAWGCVGIGEACRDASLAYSRDRVQFGKPLAEHQLIRRHLTNMITDVHAARLLCESAARLWARRDHEAIQATLIAKYYGALMATRVASDAVQVHGARGLSSDFPVARHYRDARVMEIVEGSNEVQQLMISENGLRTQRQVESESS
jgi:alkylation response protein AidB-like acyl-CoA dehydrogenase